MVLPGVLFKMVDWFLYQLLANSYYRAATKIRSFCFQNKTTTTKPIPTNQAASYPSVSKCPLDCRATHTVVCDVNGCLLRSPSFFPFFMLVAFEGGSIPRAFVLLLVYPLLCLLNHDLALRIMVFISFCGLKLKDAQTLARAVLPKFFLENLHLQAYEVLASCKRRVVVTSVPRVMVEGFLKEYLNVDVVVGSELPMVAGGRFTGLLSAASPPVRSKVLKQVLGDAKPDVGLIRSRNNVEEQHFLSLCKEVYVVYGEDSTERNNGSSSVMPREKYPKPLVFHDGRLAFLPTPMASFTLFAWLPFGILLAILRMVLAVILPISMSRIAGAMSGIKVRVKGLERLQNTSCDHGGERSGVLYVCTHRTLLDPVVLSSALRKPLTAVTYSLSRTSEVLSPIKTVRLTRKREQDGETMKKLLRQGDLVVCPEGTTCREPYLLRFSPLFAELAEDMVPVAVNVSVGMFYGTTASGLKCLDPIFFLMNPFPTYDLEFMGRVPREWTCSGGKSSWEVANRIQKQLADALGFECTNLTRRDKYMMLAGNEGSVSQNR
ncbi:glycerol-3-phosphate acyltransferase 1-like [Nymphaea colorata]|nr:glycerol-3-phosphate acyltransferase 1-like [Nymphaea colorata]